jgi:hypothetical protein
MFQPFFRVRGAFTQLTWGLPMANQSWRVDCAQANEGPSQQPSYIRYIGFYFRAPQFEYTGGILNWDTNYIFVKAVLAERSALAAFFTGCWRHLSYLKIHSAWVGFSSSFVSSSQTIGLCTGPKLWAFYVELVKFLSDIRWTQGEAPSSRHSLSKSCDDGARFGYLDRVLTVKRARILTRRIHSSTNSFHTPSIQPSTFLLSILLHSLTPSLASQVCVFLSLICSYSVPLLRHQFKILIDLRGPIMVTSFLED